MISLLFLLVFSGCEEEIIRRKDVQDYDPANPSFYNIMKEWYLWYDEMPEIDPKNYSTPQEVLEAVRYSKDEWSYITSREEFDQFYQQGAYIGYGYGQKWDAEGNLRISFVFEDSPLKENNIERGWTIAAINGTDINPTIDINRLTGADEVGVENDYLLVSPHGDTVSATFVKEEITMNTVLHTSIQENKGHKTGYLVISSFIEKTKDELADAFQQFANANINNLVIDLRYNGGGMLSMANETANYVISSNEIGKLFTKLVLNDKKQEQNTYHYFEDDSLSLAWSFDKVYFITTRATASASEALINGLSPYMDVYVIGQKTYGKPVGMYLFHDTDERYAFLPVCFEVVNANDETGYFDGLPVDVHVADDLDSPFGSTQEDCFSQALYHIENGTFNPPKLIKRSPYNHVEYKSIRDIIGAQ
jgi:C-terminal processing protease CtpA/Prc